MNKTKFKDILSKDVKAYERLKSELEEAYQEVMEEKRNIVKIRIAEMAAEVGFDFELHLPEETESEMPAGHWHFIDGDFYFNRVGKNSREVQAALDRIGAEKRKPFIVPDGEVPEHVKREFLNSLRERSR